MRKLTPALVFVFVFAVSAFAQERPRYYDNFDTQKSVMAMSPAGRGQREAGRASVKRLQNPYTPSPIIGRDRDQRPLREAKYVAKTVQATMTVYDGYAQAEAPRPTAAPQIKLSVGNSLRGYSTGDAAIDSYIVDSSRRYNIDPLLIYAQMNQESSFKIRALSPKGASGLMQLMPPTARRMGVTNIYDPRQNIEGGVRYMRLLLNLFGGDVSLALAGYNAGEGAVMKYGNKIPPYAETRDYVKRISARYQSISNSSTTTRYPKKAGSPLNAKAGSAGRFRSDDYKPSTATVRLDDGRTRLINK